MEAETIAKHLMDDKRFNDKVSAALSTKNDGAFAINSDEEYHNIQLLLADAYTALVEYNITGKPISEGNVDILFHCLTELHRLSGFEWVRWADSVSQSKRLANRQVR